jgi:HEAT repeat protein
MLVCRDELRGWIGSFTRYKGPGASSDLPCWLEFFRAETAIIDRKTGTRPTLFIPRAAVSVCGTIQPAPLARVMTLEHLESGLAARLLLAMPPAKCKVWSEAEVTPEVRQRYGEVLRKLTQLQPDTDENGDAEPFTLRLSAAAKMAWIKFYNDWAARQVEATGELAACFAKLEAYAARLALLHHVVTRVHTEGDDCEPLDVASVEAGITLARWFGHEAERVYAMFAESAEARTTRQLVDFIHARGGGVTARDVHKSNKAKYPTPEFAEAALNTLAANGVGQWVQATGQRGGRPTRKLQLKTLTPKPRNPETPATHPLENRDLVGGPTHRPAGTNGNDGAQKAKPKDPKDGLPATSPPNPPDAPKPSDVPNQVVNAQKASGNAVKPALRLSGLRRQPQPFGRIFSDLDLWKDNPVEADARYKGKVVEVEMALGDLQIKSREDGLAFLLTDTPFWDAAGLQHSAFVFSAKNRSQLVGLHKKGGTVVIRGECQGLVRGRVTFEDCEIIQTAAAQKPKQGPSDVPGNPAVAALAKALGSDNATDRIRAANELAKLGEAAKPAARALCFAATGDSQEVRLAALEALDKVQPALVQPITTLLVDPRNSYQAAQQIAAMGESANPSVPVLIWHARQDVTNNAAVDIRALARIGPKDPEAVRAIIGYGQAAVGRHEDSRKGSKTAALTALGELSENRGTLRQEIVMCLVKVLPQCETEYEFADFYLGSPLIAAIKSIGEYGTDAKAAVPLLKNLKLHKQIDVRQAATTALDKIDK